MSKNKVAIVGVGNVGSSYAYSMVNRGIADEIVLISKSLEYSEAQSMDLADGNAFLNKTVNIYPGDYNDCGDADIVCITAGVSIKENQTRLDIAHDNAELMRTIVKQVMNSGFKGIFLIASNPVDVMSYVVYKESGLPSHRVIGSGTSLDSVRLRGNLAEMFKVNPRHVHAKIIGEHGDSSVPLWSNAYVGPKPILDIINEHQDKYSLDDLTKAYEDARDAGYMILKGKGNTSYGIGVALATITQSILENQMNILSVSCYLQGEYGHNDIYIGAPAVIDKSGVREVIDLNLSKEEAEAFDNSAANIEKTIASLK